MKTFRMSFAHFYTDTVFWDWGSVHRSKCQLLHGLSSLSANTTKNNLQQSKTRLAEHIINVHSEIRWSWYINHLSRHRIVILHIHKLKGFAKISDFAFFSAVSSFHISFCLICAFSNWIPFLQIYESFSLRKQKLFLYSF